MSVPTQRLPISAIVGSHNEAHLLERCLPALVFCDERIVIDIDSSDRTAEVAERLGARVIRHSYVEIAERARMHLVDQAQYDWLLFLDPDEVFPGPLAEQLGGLLPSLSADIGAIDCPWQFWFRGKPLLGTIWGGVNRKRTLVRLEGVELGPTVHSGTQLRSGFHVHDVPYSGDNAIAHYWAPTYSSLIRKHWRYLKLEGPDRYSHGMVTGYRDIARTPIRAFFESFVSRRGYRDGLTGVALSLLWAVYSTGAKVSLLRELRR